MANTDCANPSKPVCNTSLNVCVADNPPDVTIFSTPNQWYSTNPLLAVSFSDDIGLAGGAYTVDVNPATNPAAPISIPSVSGKAYSTSSFSMSSATWNTLSQGSHTIYLEAFDSAGQCRGCDGTKTLTINKDTLAPNVSINESFATPAPASANGKYWFKGGPYTIPVNVDDGVGSGIDLNSCWYRIVDSVAGRDTGAVFRTNCASAIPLKIGPASDPTNNCVTQDDQNNSGNPSSCEIISIATDKAGNVSVDNLTKNDKFFHIDYTPPTAQ